MFIFTLPYPFYRKLVQHSKRDRSPSPGSAAEAKSGEDDAGRKRLRSVSVDK